MSYSIKVQNIGDW